MNVLFLTTEWPSAAMPTNGIFIREHAYAVAELANVAVVHVARFPGERGLYDIEQLAEEEIPVWRVRYRRFPRPLSYAAFLLGVLAGFRRACRAGFEPDVIHANSPLSAGLAVVLGTVFRKPFVYTEHWTIFIAENPRTLPLPQRLLARLALRRARLVMPVSEDLREAMARIEPNARFRVIRNAVDDSLFHPDPDRVEHGSPYRLLTTGLLDTERKGVDILVRAFALLATRRGDLRLDVVGEGGNRPVYEALAEELGVGSLITWHGWQPKSAIAELMRWADLFVLASRYENNPVVVIESLASGLPVVATRVGGVPEIVDEAVGELARPLDPYDFARAVESALARIGSFDRVAMAIGALETYGRTAIGRQLADAYEEATA